MDSSKSKGIKCEKCGKLNFEKLEYCVECGNLLQNNKEFKRALIFSLFDILSLIIVLILENDLRSNVVKGTDLIYIAKELIAGIALLDSMSLCVLASINWIWSIKNNGKNSIFLFVIFIFIFLILFYLAWN